MHIHNSKFSTKLCLIYDIFFTLLPSTKVNIKVLLCLFLLYITVYCKLLNKTQKCIFIPHSFQPSWKNVLLMFDICYGIFLFHSLQLSWTLQFLLCLFYFILQIVSQDCSTWQWTERCCWIPDTIIILTEAIFHIFILA